MGEGNERYSIQYRIYCSATHHIRQINIQKDGLHARLSLVCAIIEDLRWGKLHNAGIVLVSVLE